MWEQLGNWQLSALQNLGLEKNSKLLDIGCGPLRLGIKAIPFLDDNCFFGTELWSPYVELGQAIMNKYSDSDKAYDVKILPKFQFHRFETKFDFAIAQSVVTHLSNQQIQLLLYNLTKVMKRDGIFVFTYNNNDFPYSVFYEMKAPMITPSNLTQHFFESLADEHSIKFVTGERVVEKHPTGQAIGLFKF